MRFAPYFLCLGLAALASLACSSTPTTLAAVVRPELVAVDPADFMGRVPCEAPLDPDTGAGGQVQAPERNADAAHSYVATLFDVTPAADGGVPDPGTALASSPPTSCLKPVTFAFVVAGRRYLAEVDAYREDPDQLTPISAGSRLLSDSTGKRVVASWVATCGGYPPSPYAGVAGGGGTGGTAETAGTAGTAGSSGVGGRPPGVVSYASITQTPHDCGDGLATPQSE